jgi:hypothetical protein
MYNKIYEKRTMIEQMFEPYPRIFIQQLVVILGCYIFRSTGNNYSVLFVFVAAKMFFDLLFNSFNFGKEASTVKDAPY